MVTIITANYVLSIVIYGWTLIKMNLWVRWFYNQNVLIFNEIHKVIVNNHIKYERWTSVQIFGICKGKIS